ncbi:MAG: hypothetical protein U5N26_02745 [Candidatus Marinimicrobia bacterium]|nr:hypothetical protein [Candidatus Neomarinimicrobiota bacterium]
MKRIIYILFIVFMCAGTLQADGDAEASRYMRKLNMLPVPAPTQDAASIYAGAGFAFPEYWLPQIGVNIPFGGRYHFTGGLGAVAEPLFNELLYRFSLGFGTGGVFQGDSTFRYLAGISVNHYRAISYGNLSPGLHVRIMKTGSRFTLAAGMELSFQHHEILENDLLSERDTHLFVLMPELALYTPWGNINMKFQRDAVAAGVSWILKLG